MSPKAPVADRRFALKSALGTALSAALLPVLVSSEAVANTGREEIDPPRHPLVYSRTLMRELPRGEHFAVTRRFSVRFMPTASGFVVEGEQLSAAVDAPDELTRFAEFEEARVEAGIFPLMLDSAGHIVSGASGRHSEEVEQALKAVAERLRTSRYDPQDLASIEALVESVHRAGASLTTQLPHDLFAPSEAERQRREEVALPWGETGLVTSIFAAERDPATGLMRRARREVITELPNSRRSTMEQWRLGEE